MTYDIIMMTNTFVWSVKMNEISVARVCEFLDKLEEKGIYYKLNKVRDAIMVEVAVPGERWEIEFMCDGQIVTEKFKSTGIEFGEEELERLIKEYGDNA